jgi:transposase
MEAKTNRKRKKHTEEFKREAVRLLENRGERTIADVAASLGVAENLLHAWKRKLGSAAQQVRAERGGETPEEELKRLRRENAQLREERAVLKESVAFFARDRS